MLTERGARRLVTIAANVGAIAFGFGVAWLTGFRLWGMVVAPITGTIGWFAGWFLGRALGRRLARLGYAPGGQPVYRLGTVPEPETTAGGKARSLSTLVRAGQRVPPGLVVLPRAFDDTGLTDQARHALGSELGRLNTAGRFAVRSSATSEDSATASFAGAYETLLDVPAGQVVDAIGRVRASATTGRVAAYSRAAGVHAGDIAVVVQEMVPAQYAGVLFTVHPLTGDLSTMLGTVVAELGEAVVSGDQTGEQFTLARPSGDYQGPDALRPCTPRRTGSRGPSAAPHRTSSGRWPTARCGYCRRVPSPR